MPTDPGLASLQQLFDERERLRRQHFSRPAGATVCRRQADEQWTPRRKALAEGWRCRQAACWPANRALAGGAAPMVSGGGGQRPPARGSAAPGAGRAGRARRSAAGAAGAGGGGSAASADPEPAGGSSGSWPAIWPNSSPLPAERRAEQQPEIPARWFEPAQWRRAGSPSPGSGWASRHRNNKKGAQIWAPCFMLQPCLQRLAGPPAAAAR